VDAVEVDPDQRPQQRLAGQEPDRGRHLAHIIDVSEIGTGQQQGLGDAGCRRSPPEHGHGRLNVRRAARNAASSSMAAVNGPVSSAGPVQAAWPRTWAVRISAMVTRSSLELLAMRSSA
jgi:hypothetical protein